jgi:hypothetical protein
MPEPPAAEPSGVAGRLKNRQPSPGAPDPNPLAAHRQLPRQWGVVAPLLLMALAGVAYLWFVHHFGVSVVRTDEWTLVPMVGAMHAGQLTLGMLWSQHQENRMLVPNLIQILLARATHFDMRAPMYLGAALLILTLVVLVAFYRGMGRWAYWAMVPVAVLLLSWVQVWNALFGFQMAWYLVLLCLAVVIACLARPGYVPYALALAAALVASYSSLQGLFLWPCGLAMLLWWPSAGRRATGWVGAGIVATTIYFYQYNFNTGGAPLLSYVLDHHRAAVKYLLITIGTVMPGLRSAATAASPQGSLAATGVAGALILGLALVALVAIVWLGRPDPYLRGAFALIVFGLLFDLAVDLGRAFSGANQLFVLWRYPTYNLVMLAGVWLVAVRLWQRLGPSRLPVLRLVTGGLLALLVVQAGLAYHFGAAEAATTASQSRTARDVLANFRTAPPTLENQYLVLDWPEVQSWAPILVRLQDNVFDGSAAAAYRRIGIVPGGVRGRLLPVPADLSSDLSSSPLAARAWGVLSTIYDQLPTLRGAYPLAEPGFAKALMRWAAGPAQQEPTVAEYLAPYRKVLAQLEAKA